MKYLLDKGHSPNIKGHIGYSPKKRNSVVSNIWGACTYNGQLSVLKSLFALLDPGGLQAKCEERKSVSGTWQKEVFSSTPLMLAAISGHLHVVRWLIEEKKCEADGTDWQENTLLHLAVKYNRKDLVEYFVDKGLINPFQRNALGETPASMAKDLDLDDLQAILSRCKDDSQQKIEELLNMLNEEEERKERKKKKTGRKKKNKEALEKSREEKKEEGEQQTEEQQSEHHSNDESISAGSETKDPPHAEELPKDPPEQEVRSAESAEHSDKDAGSEEKSAHRGRYHGEYGARRRWEFGRYGRHAYRGRKVYVPRDRAYGRYRGSRYVVKEVHKELAEEPEEIQAVPTADPAHEKIEQIEPDSNNNEKEQEVVTEEIKSEPATKEITEEPIQDEAAQHNAEDKKEEPPEESKSMSSAQEENADAAKELTAMIKSELQSSAVFSNEDSGIFTPREFDAEGREVRSATRLKIDEVVQTETITPEKVIEELEKDNEIAQKMGYDFAVLLMISS